MFMTDDEYRPRPIRQDDARAVIGIVARLIGLIAAGQIDSQYVELFRQRGVRDGYLADNTGEHELLQAFSDLIARLRFTLGEYEQMPPQEPFPHS